MTQAEKASVEGIKAASNGLRGSIADELVGGTEDVSDATSKLLEFHGTYLQDDRDDRKARRIQAGPPAGRIVGRLLPSHGGRAITSGSQDRSF